VIAIGVLAAVATVGCSGSPTGDPGTTVTTATVTIGTGTIGTGTIGTGTTVDTVTAEPPVTVVGEELVGRWAHFDVVAYEDGVLKTLIISYGFNDFSVVDGRVIDSASFCFAEQRTDQPIETTLSDAATQAIQPPSTPVEVDLVDGTLRIRRAATPTPVGMVLDDPGVDALPADASDPRIVDADGDGKPGITVGIRVTDELTGELYIARLEVFAWEGTLVTPDRIEGQVTDTSQQLVLGASDPVFATAGSAWVQHADLAESPIVLVRVDESWDCERLAAERDRLLPPVPAIDW
jgi:hypothetical protein